jgi:hypothetical protein
MCYRLDQQLYSAHRNYVQFIYAGTIMRLMQASLMCGAIALAMVAYPAAARVRVGVVIGVPGPWYPYPRYYDHYYDPYYYPPRYYYPPVVALPVPSAPPTYVQQPYAQQPMGQQADEQQSSQQENNDNYWYYCAAEKAYYPYVKQCPAGWTRVAPKPPSAP